MVTPKCRHCGAKVWQVSAGLVCDDCASKIVPNRLYEQQMVLPIDWGTVEKIGQRRLRLAGGQPETLDEQNERLAEHGERQRELTFDD